MDTEKPDLTPSAGVARVRKPTFATVWRGYDPNQVLEYLGRVADHVQDLENQVRKLDSELREARRQDMALQDLGPASQDPYEIVSARVADLLRTFDQDVQRLRGEAEAEAAHIVAEANAEAERIDQAVEDLRRQTEAERNRILAEARAEADSIRLDAQSKAEEVRALAERALRDAREAADRAVSTLASRRDALLRELQAMRDRMFDTARDLEAAIEGAAVADQLVIVEDAPRSDSADTTSIRLPEVQPESGL